MEASATDGRRESENKRWGVLLRGEYVEQHDTKDTSVMIGPVLMF